ncbi:MAG TPA: amino acid ABC transporter ATP-binding protein [bacterium]|nr:amino acid ABC transporter ATP-binding protein [bacterium]
MPPKLRIVDLHKRYGHLEVLKGINLEVQWGEKVVLIGPSGAGKSTLLRCINFLEKPSAGHIYLDGELIGERPANGGYAHLGERELAVTRARIGMVFQRFNLFPHLSALENVAIGPYRVLSKTKAESERIAAALIEKVGLGAKANAFPERLSGGQQQRVAIARALAMQPSLMLFDEPTSALDPELIGEVLQVIRQLAAEGMTMLIVTHEVNFAEDVADRVLFVDDGVIVEEGSPQAILRSPQHTRTRSFLRAVLER